MPLAKSSLLGQKTLAMMSFGITEKVSSQYKRSVMLGATMLNRVPSFLHAMMLSAVIASVVMLGVPVTSVSRPQCYKTFSVRNFQIFAIS